LNFTIFESIKNPTLKLVAIQLQHSSVFTLLYHLIMYFTFANCHYKQRERRLYKDWRSFSFVKRPRRSPTQTYFCNKCIFIL